MADNSFLITEIGLCDLDPDLTGRHGLSVLTRIEIVCYLTRVAGSPLCRARSVYFVFPVASRAGLTPLLPKPAQPRQPWPVLTPSRLSYHTVMAQRVTLYLSFKVCVRTRVILHLLLFV